MNNAPHVRLAEVPRRYFSLAALRSMIVTWRERKRFRAELAQMSKANPHLIDDIGLTRHQVEAEIAKPPPIAFSACTSAERAWWHRR